MLMEVEMINGVGELSVVGLLWGVYMLSGNVGVGHYMTYKI